MMAIGVKHDGPALIDHYFEGAALYRHAAITDARGSLVAIEQGRNVPFEIARVYYLYGQSDGVTRGFHAHRALRQWAICVAGSCRMRLYDGRKWKEARLDRPDLGLLLGPMIWHELDEFAPDTVVVMLASAPFDESDYIRDRATFEAVAGPRTR